MAGEGICHMTALTDQNGIKDTQSLQASGTGLSTGDFFFPYNSNFSTNGYASVHIYYWCGIFCLSGSSAFPQ